MTAVGYSISERLDITITSLRPLIINASASSRPMPMTRRNARHSSRDINMERTPIQRQHRQLAHRPIHRPTRASSPRSRFRPYSRPPLHIITSTSFVRDDLFQMITRLIHLCDTEHGFLARKMVDPAESCRCQCALHPRPADACKVPLDDIGRCVSVELAAHVLEDLGGCHVDVFDSREIEDDCLERRPWVCRYCRIVDLSRTRKLQPA